MSSEGKKTSEEDRSKVGYWLKFIKRAKKASKEHFDDTKDAYAEAEYRSVDRTGDFETVSRKLRGYPIYKFSCDLLQPAFYSKIPKVVAKRKFGVEDEMALTMGLIAERLGQVLVDDGYFGEAMEAARNDFIHGGKATTQVIYTTETESFRIPLTQVEEDYIGEDGSVFEEEVFQDEGGYYGEGTKAKEETQRLYLAPVCFDEVLHTPEAKCFSEVNEIAYRVWVEKDKAEELFNPDGKKSLSYSTKRRGKAGAEDSDDYDEDESGGKEERAPGLAAWECYCKHSRKVYFVSEDFSEDFLLTKDDDYEFSGFFPSPPFALYNKHRKSLYTTPNWVYLEGTANQLNLLYQRIFGLIDSIRRRALVYGASPELIEALNRVEGEEFIATGTLSEILDKGGIANLIQWVPVAELVQALTEAMQIEEHFKNLFYEWFGVPDIMRGVSDPGETAEAQGIKSAASGDRFKLLKKKMVDLARDSAEMMLDLALKVYPDEKIAKLCGYEYMASGAEGVQPSEENPEGEAPTFGHKDRFFKALALLREDGQRLVRIEFETESTNFKDEERELERQQMVSTTVMQGLNAIAGIQNPMFVPIALHMLLATLESMGGTSQSEDMIKTSIAELQKMKDEPPEEEGPDVEMMKVEIKQRELELKTFQEQMKAQAEQYKLQQKDQEISIKGMEKQAEVQIAQFSATQSAETEKVLVTIEQQRLQIEQFKAQIQAQEAFLEEIRLKGESDAQLLQMALQAKEQGANGGKEKNVAPQIIQLPAPPAQNINLELNMPKPGTKKGKVIRPDGSVLEFESTESDSGDVSSTEVNPLAFPPIDE